MSEYNNSMDIMDDGMTFETPAHAGRTLKRLWRFVNDQHKRLTIVLVSVVFYTFLSIIAPAYSAHIVDLLWNGIKAAITDGTAFRVTWADGGRDIFYLLLIYLATALFYTLQAYLMSSFAEKLSLRLRTEISAKLSRLPLSFFDRTKTGAVLSWTVNDLDKMSEALQTGLLKLFTAAGMVVGSLIMMFRFSVSLTLIFMLFTGIALISMNLFSAKTLKYAIERQRCVSNVTAHVEEAYSGRVIIKAFNQEENSSEKMHRATQELAESTRKAEFMINAINPAIRLINRFGQVLIAVLAGKMLLDGILTVGVFQAFFQYVNQSSEPLTEVAYMVNSMQSALASLERIYDLLDEEELSSEPAAPLTVHDAEGKVEFQNVRFGYTADRMLMRNISFSVRPGQKVAIVGSTGAGKTTTALAILRLLPFRTGKIAGGKILLEGTDLLEEKEEAMRAVRGDKIAMIFQDPMTSLNPVMRVGDQIAENLELHNRDKRSKADIEKRVCEMLELVGIPSRRRNEYPHQFSGGMKQRVVIAMALACSPELLIADEPTTALDVTIQAQVLAMMDELKEQLGTSMIMITHDLGVVAQTCDKVAIMYAGEIIEYGTIYDLFEGDRHHPYTVGLFGSIPDLSAHKNRLTPIDGLMPDPTALPGGCKFHPRCPQCMEICKTHRPPLYKSGTHHISCHLFAKEEQA